MGGFLLLSGRLRDLQSLWGFMWQSALKVLYLTRARRVRNTLHIL